MNRLTAILLLVSLAVSARFIRAQELDSLEAPLVGCYRLELGEWDHPLEPSIARAQTPPPRFELKDERGPVGYYLEHEMLLVRPRIDGERDTGATWHPAARDSVRIVWTAGVHGVTLRLSVEKDGRRLEGKAVAWTDVAGQLRPQARAEARRVACDTESRNRALP